MDLQRHIDYIHYNPVKHALVNCPKDYPYLIFHSYAKAGVYEESWGCRETFDFKAIASTVGE